MRGCCGLLKNVASWVRQPKANQEENLNELT